MTFEDLTGVRFNNLEVLRFLRATPRGNVWLAACTRRLESGEQCTNTREILASDVKAKRVTACKPCAAEAHKRHRRTWTASKRAAHFAAKG